MPGDGGQNTFDRIYRKFHTWIHRNVRNDSQHWCSRIYCINTSFSRNLAHVHNTIYLVRINTAVPGMVPVYCCTGTVPVCVPQVPGIGILYDMNMMPWWHVPGNLDPRFHGCIPGILVATNTMRQSVSRGLTVSNYVPVVLIVWTCEHPAVHESTRCKLRRVAGAIQNGHSFSSLLFVPIAKLRPTSWGHITWKYYIKLCSWTTFAAKGLPGTGTPVPYVSCGVTDKLLV